MNNHKKSSRIALFILISIILLFSTIYSCLAITMSNEDYEITEQMIVSGNIMNNSEYELNEVLGITFSGFGQNGEYQTYSGFYNNFSIIINDDDDYVPPIGGGGGIIPDIISKPSETNFTQESIEKIKLSEIILNNWWYLLLIIFIISLVLKIPYKIKSYVVEKTNITDDKDKKRQ